MIVRSVPTKAINPDKKLYFITFQLNIPAPPVYTLGSLNCTAVFTADNVAIPTSNIPSENPKIFLGSTKIIGIKNDPIIPKNPMYINKLHQLFNFKFFKNDILFFLMFY